MNQLNKHAIFLVQVLRHMFGTIDRTVLAACATERHLQVCKIAFEESLYVMVHEGIYMRQERQYFAIVLQKVNHRLVQAREGFELVVLTGVVGTTAVEDVTATVTGGVFRNTALKGEGVNRY